MQKFFYVLFFITLYSCDNTLCPTMDKYSSVRTDAAMNVRILTTGDALVTLTSVEKVALSNANGTSFTVVVDDNISYNAISIEASQSDNGIHVLKNPGFSQVPYYNKGFVKVEPSGSNAMQVNINPGNISTTGVSIVIDEMSGL
jgi:hypothetical protein